MVPTLSLNTIINPPVFFSTRYLLSVLSTQPVPPMKPLAKLNTAFWEPHETDGRASRGMDKSV